MTNLGKQRYDEIPIPAALDTVINDAITRYQRDAWHKAVRKYTLSAVAAVLLLFTAANFPPIYAYAADLPILGTIVRVLHVGSGGKVTDGVHTAADATGETVSLRFEADAQATATAPVYTATHLHAPNRLVLTLSGVRTLDFPSIERSLRQADAVRDVYRSMIADDSSYGFVIVLKPGYDYEITELANPASLSLHFFPSEQSTQTTYYYLRTATMPYGEELSMLSETLYKEHPTQLKTADGNYIVTVGEYVTEAEATAALQSIEQRSGGTSGLTVARGTAADIPQN